MAIRKKRKAIQNQETEEVIRRKVRNNDNLELRTIKPLTPNQERTFDSYYGGKQLLLKGTAGSGKSFQACYLAIQEILEDDSPYDKLVIIRSALPSRDIGFLPGNQKEKMAVYELPYKQIFQDLFNRGDAYEILTKKGKIQFECTSFLRGTTFNNCIILLDEVASMTLHEIDTIITRIGSDCRIIICGDEKQSDIQKPHEKSGIVDLTKIIKQMKEFDIINFKITDIVRSGLVKSWITEKENLGY